jgi:hypothetical protein
MYGSSTTSLTDDRAVLDLVIGEGGILSGLRQNTIHIGTSTISPSVSTQLGEMHACIVGCKYLPQNYKNCLFREQALDVEVVGLNYDTMYRRLIRSYIC